MMKRYIFAIILLCNAVSWAVAQNLQAKLDHYSTEQGLSSNYVSDIIADRFGYVWVATWNDLNRFDGYNFRIYNTGKASGVPHLHNRIHELHADRNGNIWMHMYDDRFFVLNRKKDRIENAFTGIKGGEEFRVADALTEAKYTVSYCISVARDGHVYIVIPSQGIYQLWLDGDKRVTRKLIDKKYGGYNVITDGQGNPWVACNDGLRMFDAKTGRQHGNLMLKDVHINTMSFHGTDLYIGTPEGKILIRDTKYCVTRPVDANTGGKPITSLYVDKSDVVWFTTPDQGISRFDPKTKTTKTFHQEVPYPESFLSEAHVYDEGNYVWAQMSRGGFGYYNRAKDDMNYFHNSPDNRWNLSNTVSSYWTMPEGVMFMSTIQRGLEKLSLFSNRIERIYPSQKDFTYGVNEVRAMVYDKFSRRTLVGNKAGNIFEFNPVTRQIVPTPVYHINGRIYHMMQDKSGQIWVSTKGEGIFVIPRNGQPKHLDIKLPCQDVYEILEDNAGRIWIATYNGGVNMLRKNPKGQWDLVTVDRIIGYPRKSYSKVRILAYDGKNTIWAGTSDGILVLHHDDALKRVVAEPIVQTTDEEEQLANNDIIEIAKAPNGEMWIATNGGGLSHAYERDDNGKWHFENFGLDNGLPTNEIRSITFTSNGDVWFSADQVICSYNPEKKFISTFTYTDGVDEVANSEAGALTLPNGIMLFGTLNGIYVVDKNKLGERTASEYKLAITDFFINDQLMSPRLNDDYDYSIPDSGYVELPSRSSVFAFRFASLNYSLQHRIHYQYMLEGFDKEWKNADLSRTATYNDVPAGKYKFRVRAFLLENPDKYDERVIEVVVPPFMLTSPIALWIYLALIFMGVAGFFVWRRKMKERGPKNLRVLKLGPNEIAFQKEDDYKFVKDLLDWLEEHYMDTNLKIEDLVKTSNMSRTAFYNQLKQLTGQAPKEFVSDFRLKKAIMYLRNDNCTIVEIAFKTGFNDPVYFTRLFKQKMGVTPSAYRENKEILTEKQ